MRARARACVCRLSAQHCRRRISWLKRAQTTHLSAIVQDEEEGHYDSDGHQQAEAVSAARQLFAKCCLLREAGCVDVEGRRRRSELIVGLDLLGRIERAARSRPRVHRRHRRALFGERNFLGGGGVGGELLEADPLAHLALEIQVDLGHARPHLAATERANGVAGAASDGTRLAALQQANPAAAAEAVAAREHDGAEQQLDADGAAVLRRPRRGEARSHRPPSRGKAWSVRAGICFGANMLKRWRQGKVDIFMPQLRLLSTRR